MPEAFFVRRKAVKSLQTVDKQTANATAFYHCDEPIAGFVEQPLCCGLPDHLHMALFDQLFNRQVQRPCLVENCRRCFVKPEMDADVISIALAEEVQADCGLADTRRTDEERGRTMREAPAHNPVELCETGRYSRAGDAFHDRRMGQQCFGPGIHNNTIIGDAVRMRPPQVTGPAQ